MNFFFLNLATRKYEKERKKEKKSNECFSTMEKVIHLRVTGLQGTSYMVFRTGWAGGTLRAEWEPGRRAKVKAKAKERPRVKPRR